MSGFVCHRTSDHLLLIGVAPGDAPAQDVHLVGTGNCLLLALPDFQQKWPLPLQSELCPIRPMTILSVLLYAGNPE
jgi:hypothetical protein